MNYRRMIQTMNNYEKLLLYYAEKVFTEKQWKRIKDNASDISLYGVDGLRRLVASKSIEAFTRLYFYEEFYLPFASIHYNMLSDMQDVHDRAIAGLSGRKIANAIPRGHAKSTFYSRILPLHGFLYDWSPLTVLLGNNDDAAKRFVANIKNIIETNNAIQQDFPDIKGSSWGYEKLQSNNGSVITSFGVGSGSIRGINTPSRPALVILDDIDDDKSVRSAVELANNIDWFSKAVMALGAIDDTTSYIAVGTIIRRTSLMKHILERPNFNSRIEQRIKRWSSNVELWNQWQEIYLDLARKGEQPKDAVEDTFYQNNKAALLQDTEVLWNRNDEYYKAMVWKLANGDKAFNSEMQNTPAETDSMLVPTFISPNGINESEYDVLAALDPTIAGGKANDLAAYVEVLYHRKTKKIIVWYVDAKRRTYAQTIDIVVNRLKKRKVNGLWIEDNAHGLIVKDLINEKLRQEKIPLQAIGIYNTLPKNDRIGALSEYMNRGDIVFIDTIAQELRDELNNWPISGTDDVLDSISNIVLYLKDKGLLPRIEIPNVYT